MIPLDVKTVPQVIICNTDVTTGILSGTYIKLLKFRITQFLDFELLIFKKPPNTKKSCHQKHFFSQISRISKSTSQVFEKLKQSSEPKTF